MMKFIHCLVLNTRLNYQLVQKKVTSVLLIFGMNLKEFLKKFAELLEKISKSIQVMGLSITNCVNTGKVSGGAENSPSGIIGDCMDTSETIISGCINYGENLSITSGKSDYVKVYNSYSLYVDSAGSNGSPLLRGTQVTKEAFESGEVAYLLNSGGSTRTWYQNFSMQELYPKTEGEPATETVYRGYESGKLKTDDNFAINAKGASENGIWQDRVFPSATKISSRFAIARPFVSSTSKR
mgnify:CR=1 FL=1